MEFQVFSMLEAAIGTKNMQINVVKKLLINTGTRKFGEKSLFLLIQEANKMGLKICAFCGGNFDFIGMRRREPVFPK